MSIILTTYQHLKYLGVDLGEVDVHITNFVISHHNMDSSIMVTMRIGDVF